MAVLIHIDELKMLWFNDNFTVLTSITIFIEQQPISQITHFTCNDTTAHQHMGNYNDNDYFKV